MSYMEENHQNNSKKGRRKESLVEKYKGLGKKIWKRLRGADYYLQRERNTWYKREQDVDDQEKE